MTHESLREYLISQLNNEKSTRLFGRRYRPEGTVNVENTDNGQFDPLQQAKISIGRSFWWRSTYTDDNGHFVSPKRYRGKVRIRAKWRGYTATIRKTWNEVLGIQVSDHLMTIKRRHNNRTRNIAYLEPHSGIFGIDLRGGHLWVKGTVHNGLRRYIDYANGNGINHNVSYANVWAWAGGTASAAPMLKRFPMLPQMASIAGIGQSNFWHAMIQFVASNGIGLVPPWLRPDFIIAGVGTKQVNGTGPSNTVRIHQVIFHEAAHFSHALKAGSWFWANVFATEMSNDILEGGPYADGTEPSFQAGARIGLAEGWASFAEFKITNFYYDKSYISAAGFNSDFFDATAAGNGNSIERYMENFIVFDRPMNAPRFDDRGWFLHGIMWDLIDDRNEIRINGLSLSQHVNGNGDFLNDITDNANISGVDEFDLSPIFNQLDGSVNDARDLRDRLWAAFPNEIVDLRLLFWSYGY